MIDAYLSGLERAPANVHHLSQIHTVASCSETIAAGGTSLGTVRRPGAPLNGSCGLAGSSANRSDSLSPSAATIDSGEHPEKQWRRTRPSSPSVIERDGLRSS